MEKPTPASRLFSAEKYRSRWRLRKLRKQAIQRLNLYSCIDIYAHSCLRPISIGRKPCSNSKTHVQIMKFTCRLNMGFGRRHWSMRRDVMCLVETKWPTLKKLRGFRCVFTLLMLFSRDFKWIRVKMQE